MQIKVVMNKYCTVHSIWLYIIFYLQKFVLFDISFQV